MKLKGVDARSKGVRSWGSSGGQWRAREDNEELGNGGSIRVYIGFRRGIIDWGGKVCQNVLVCEEIAQCNKCGGSMLRLRDYFKQCKFF